MNHGVWLPWENKECRKWYHIGWGDIKFLSENHSAKGAIMNRETCKKLLENGVLAGWSSGKTIQHKEYGKWYDIGWDDLDFSIPAENYRVKPEPVTMPVRSCVYMCDHTQLLITADEVPFDADEITRVTLHRD